MPYSAPQARPRGGEAVCEDSRQLFAVCKHFGVNHLIYAGFAIYWRLLMSPGGMLGNVAARGDVLGLAPGRNRGREQGNGPPRALARTYPAFGGWPCNSGSYSTSTIPPSGGNQPAGRPCTGKIREDDVKLLRAHEYIGRPLGVGGRETCWQCLAEKPDRQQ